MRSAPVFECTSVHLTRGPGAVVHRERVFRGHEGTVIQMMVLGERLLSLGTDNRLLVWDLQDCKAPLVTPLTQYWNELG